MGCQISTAPKPSQSSPCDTKLQHGINQLKNLKYSLDEINDFEIYFKYQSDDMKNEIIYNSFTLDLVEHVLMKNPDFTSNITSTRHNSIQLHDKLIWYIECVDKKDLFCPQTTFNQIIDKNDNWKKDIDREKHREYYYLSALYYLFMGDLKDIDEQDITTVICVFTDFVNIDCKQPEIVEKKESNWEKLLRLLFIGFDFQKIIEIMRLQAQGDVKIKHKVESMTDLINMVEKPTAVGRGKSKKKNIYNKCRSKSKKYKQHGGMEPLTFGLFTVAILAMGGLGTAAAVYGIGEVTTGAIALFESIATTTNIGALTGVLGGGGMVTVGILFVLGIAGFLLVWKLWGGAAISEVTKQRTLLEGNIERQKVALMADILQKANAVDAIETTAIHQIGINRGTIYNFIKGTTDDIIREFGHLYDKLMTCINYNETCMFPNPSKTPIKYNIDIYRDEVEQLHSEIKQYTDWLKITLLNLLSDSTRDQVIKEMTMLDMQNTPAQGNNEDNLILRLGGGTIEEYKYEFAPIPAFNNVFGDFEDKVNYFLNRRIELTKKFEIPYKITFQMRLTELDRHKESMEKALKLIHNERFWPGDKRQRNYLEKAELAARNRELGDEIYNNAKSAAKFFSEKFWHEIAEDKEAERRIYKLARIAQIGAVQEGQTAALGQIDQFSDFVMKGLEKMQKMGTMTPAEKSSFQEEIKTFVATHEKEEVQDVQQYLNRLAKEQKKEEQDRKKEEAIKQKNREKTKRDVEQRARDREAINTKPRHTYRSTPRHTSRSTPRHTSRNRYTSKSTPRDTQEFYNEDENSNHNEPTTMTQPTPRHTSNLTSIDEEIDQLKKQIKAIKKKHTKAKEHQDNVTRKKLRKQHQILMEKWKRLESQKNSHTPEPKPNNEEYSNSEEYSSDDEPRTMREPTPMRQRRSNTPMRQRRSRKSNNNTLTPLQRRAIQRQARQMNNNNSNY